MVAKGESAVDADKKLAAVSTTLEEMKAELQTTKEDLKAIVKVRRYRTHVITCMRDHDYE